MSLDFDAHLVDESRRFIDAIDAADPDATVPSCPDWTVTDLLWHLGEVQHFWAAIVRDRMLDPNSYNEPARPGSVTGLHNFFQQSHADLCQALTTTDDAVPVWTWFDPDQTVGFIRRRQAHEALVHRFDAELASGPIGDTDAHLATDGILEAIEWMFGGSPEWADVSTDGPVGRVATTDTDASWLVQVRRWSGTSPNTGTTYTNEPVLAIVDHGDTSFDISAPATTLHRWVWSRGVEELPTITGDASGIEMMIRDGMQ